MVETLIVTPAFTCLLALADHVLGEAVLLNLYLYNLQNVIIISENGYATSMYSDSLGER